MQFHRELCGDFTSEIGLELDHPVELAIEAASPQLSVRSRISELQGYPHLACFAAHRSRKQVRHCELTGKFAHWFGLPTVRHHRYAGDNFELGRATRKRGDD